MKQYLLLLIMLLSTARLFSQVYSQELPENIRERLLWIKANTKLKLDSCRTNIFVGNLRIGFLSEKLICNTVSLEDIDQYAQYLNWKIVYDDEMIARMIQLLNNEYRQDELDTLVNRQMVFYDQDSWYEQRAMDEMQADTSKVFLQVKDSLNRNRDREVHPGLYQDFDVFQYLGLDTTARCHFLVDSIKIALREETTNRYLKTYVSIIKDIVMQCGFIKDKRLIEPLINLYNKLKKNNTEDEEDQRSLIYQVKWSLFSMRVEPYYSNVLKSLIYSLDEVRKMEFAGPLYALAEILNNQDSFRELSKYMFSDAPTGATSEYGFQGHAYYDAFKYIKKFIENEDLQKMISAKDFNIDIEKNRQKVYDWMQKNYGKYKIKRAW